MNKIELHPAAVWVCDTCGKEHFIRCVELSDEAGVGMAWLTHPESVKCDDCKSAFEVEYEDGPPIEDDELLEAWGRFRKALEKIAAYDADRHPACPHSCSEIARAALAGTEQK